LVISTWLISVNWPSTGSSKTIESITETLDLFVFGLQIEGY